jgi:hypothetical protein
MTPYNSSRRLGQVSRPNAKEGKCSAKRNGTAESETNLALDGPLVSRDLVLASSRVDLAIGSLVETDDGNVVGDGGSLVDGGEDEGHVHSRVVVLSVVVDDTTGETLLLEHGERLEGLGLAWKRREKGYEKSARLKKQEEEGRERTHHVSSDVTLSASEKVVHLASGVVVWQLPPGVDRKENAGREII